MTALEFRWTTSRGRDTYGYNICSLYVNGDKVSSCNGGGYDMKGTALGNWIERAFADRLVKLKPSQMEEHSHWEPAEKPGRFCFNDGCTHNHETLLTKLIVDSSESEDPDKISNADLYVIPEGLFVGHDGVPCPHCGGETTRDRDAGKRVNDGRYFYGLTFHDPDYDPGKARIGTKKVSDRTLGSKGKGKTVEQAEADGESLGLERYQAFYSASSKKPTKRHRVPSIDGACGMSSVERIMKAIGLELKWIPTTRGRDSIYELIDKRAKKQ